MITMQTGNGGSAVASCIDTEVLGFCLCINVSYIKYLVNEMTMLLLDFVLCEHDKQK